MSTVEYEHENEEALSVVNFTPPQVVIGDRVLFYQDGRKNGSPVVAIVTKISISGRTLRVQPLASTGRNFDSVRHISDPRLVGNDHLREWGVWELPKDVELLSDLKSRVEFLEGLVKTLLSRDDCEGSGGEEDDEDLNAARAECDLLGIPYHHRAKAETLRQKITAFKSGQSPE